MSGSDVVIRGRLRHVLSDVTRDIVICRLTRSVPKRVPPWLNVQWAPNLRPEDDVSLQRQLSCSRVSPRKNDFSLTSKAKTFLAIVEHRQPASSRLSRECNGAVNISRYASGKKKGEKKKRKRRTNPLCPVETSPFFRLSPSSLFVVCPFSFSPPTFLLEGFCPVSRRERFVFNGREKWKQRSARRRRRYRSP